MNNPYLYPDQCEWTEDYWELKALRSRPKDEDDGEDIEDLLFFCV